MNVAKRERDQAILKVFYDTISESRSDAGSVSIEELIRRSMLKKAPKFFVCSSIAARYVSLIHRGKKLPISNIHKVRMYHEIYERLKKRCKGKQIDYSLIDYIINEPAPEFYIDKETFKKRIYSASKK